MTLPFLKWPGGKRWAAPLIATLVIRSLRHTYFEPFLGGGALFFCLRPPRALLSDINADLINTYIAVQRSPGELIRRVKALPVSTQVYKRLRESAATGSLNKATRFLYLNRTAFGGIYRLNRHGQFNVPYGGGNRGPSPLWSRNLLMNASIALRNAAIELSDFEPVIESAGPGDVVYCDPTYTVTHDNNGFRRYNETNFSWADQERLARAARRAVNRGAVVLVSNAHHRSLKSLYRGAECQLLSRPSCVSADASKRRTVEEYLFVLRPPSAARSLRRARMRRFVN